MKYAFAILFALFIFPAVAHADVRITEIAWMGTQDSQYGEWIELYNDGDVGVPLAGWKLYQDGGSTLVFTYTKSIPQKGYLLLERTTASTPDPVPSIDDESGPFGGGGLSNSGENLVLKDAAGTAVQTLSYASGWPAGDAATKQTMQWDGSKWVTAAPTPKAAYGGGGSAPVDTSSTTVSGGDGKNTRAPKQAQGITFALPETVYPNIEYEFPATVSLEYMNAYDGLFKWNFGDGTAFSQTRFEVPTHTYLYPGTYTLSLQYFQYPYQKKPLFSATTPVKIVAPTITITIMPGNALSITNISDTAVDMSNWKIDTGNSEGVIPENTMLAPKAAITLGLKQFGLDAGSGAVLKTPSGSVVATTDPTIAVPTAHTLYVSPEQHTAEDTSNESVIQSSQLAADASSAVLPANLRLPVTENRTKMMIFGAIAAICIGLFILLERAMARQE